MDRLLATTALAVGVAEAYAIKNKVPGDTITERIRVYFRVKQENTGNLGAFAFIAFLGTFSAWFSAHILKHKDV